ncbi:N-acetylmuramoyl-L-alanine amidase [Cystobacter fuscus DSM 2262]|uniref:N-acetylmuramoyl-L-alanine amidase n=1 Tax=Cystobacter fuscus (strain ATCC 25194 / DSM 2262 / NBRC 100088 / M29) TaxID=1242864 RepID=S9P784_CYSF2|nr:N-acetylmuramoyl-L-alanine amidase [Cystobacter fuscus]EPX59026.1 N-acetylmuramoyl-L-alanine amidase [Cystobacter fuscus DSM 2262]
MTSRLRVLVPCLAFLLAPVASLAAERPTRIVVDPGHGGAQDGATSPSGVLEKDIALQIAQRVREHLEKELGAQVLMTRDEDVSLPLLERVEFANKQRPDLFLSIHCNAMPTKRTRARVQGLETYFLSASASNATARAAADRENAEAPSTRASRGDSTLAFILDDLARTETHQDSSRLAYAIHPKLIAASGGSDRGVLQAPFYVLNGVEAPAVLIEVGYLSHPEEGGRLARADYQEKLAIAITGGVKAFLAEVRKRDAPRSPAVAAPATP